jgi:hypothetical protein
MDSLNEKEVKVNSELTNEPSQKGLVDAKAVWDECLSIIKDNINPLSFKTWFEPIIPLKVEGKTTYNSSTKSIFL